MTSGLEIRYKHDSYILIYLVSVKSQGKFHKLADKNIFYRFHRFTTYKIIVRASRVNEAMLLGTCGELYYKIWSFK